MKIKIAIWIYSLLKKPLHLGNCFLNNTQIRNYTSTRICYFHSIHNNNKIQECQNNMVEDIQYRLYNINDETQIVNLLMKVFIGWPNFNLRNTAIN